MKVYCIGLYDNSTQKYTYFPTFTFEKDTTNTNHVKIFQGAESITLQYSSPETLLNTSQIDIVKKGIIPTVIGSSNADLKTFADEIAKNKKIPFAIFIEFYKNPNSPITGEYNAAQLMLMDDITKNPAKNQKGELICDIHNDVPLEKATDVINLNKINDNPITQKGPDQSIKSLKPTILVALKQGAASMKQGAVSMFSKSPTIVSIPTAMQNQNPLPGPTAVAVSNPINSAPTNQINVASNTASSNPNSLYNYIANIANFKTTDNSIIYDFTKLIIEKEKQVFFGFYFPFSINDINGENLSGEKVLNLLNKFFKTQNSIDRDKSFIILFENLTNYSDGIKEIIKSQIIPKLVFTQIIPTTQTNIKECVLQLNEITKVKLTLPKTILPLEETALDGYTVKSATTKGGALKRIAQQASIPRIYRPVSQRKTDYYNYT